MQNHPSLSQYPEVGLEALSVKVQALFAEYGYKEEEAGEMPFLVVALVVAKFPSHVPVEGLFYELLKSKESRTWKMGVLYLYKHYLDNHPGGQERAAEHLAECKQAIAVLEAQAALGRAMQDVEQRDGQVFRARNNPYLNAVLKEE